MSSPKLGQSMIEYVLIAVLVILGIVIMGPYVLRSIDAHFKLWDEGVQDAYTENAVQAPVSAVPNLPLNCSCNVTAGSCGSASAGFTGCNATQREYDYNCNPQGCNGAQGNFYCQNDPACCVNQSQGCQTSPCPASGCNQGATIPAINGTTCYYGYELQSNVCGTTSPSGPSPAYTCVWDAQPSGPCPLPACTGNNPPGPNSTACPNSPGTCNPPTASCPALTQGNASNFVAASCTAGTPCQYTCSSGYTYVNGICQSCKPGASHGCSGSNLITYDSCGNVTSTYTCPSPSWNGGPTGGTCACAGSTCGCLVNVGNNCCMTSEQVFCPAGVTPPNLQNAICQARGVGLQYFVGAEIDSCGKSSATSYTYDPFCGPGNVHSTGGLKYIRSVYCSPDAETVVGNLGCN